MAEGKFAGSSHASSPAFTAKSADLREGMLCAIPKPAGAVEERSIFIAVHPIYPFTHRGGCGTINTIEALRS